VEKYRGFGLLWTKRRASCCGARKNHRRLRYASIFSTAATRSAPCFRHRRRSPRLAHRCASRFPGTIRARQSGRCLEIASLILPQAALRQFPQLRYTR